MPSSHTPRKDDTHNLYVFAEDPIDALDLAQKMRGWKKRIGTHKFPDVHPLGSEETDELLERIEETENVTLKQALKDGFYGRR